MYRVISFKNILNLFAKLPTLAFIGVIRVYQIFISPIIPTNCRYTPSCSSYSIEAIKTHGLFQGIWLSSKRIVRCHPWGPWGEDPVPEANKKIRKKH